MVSNVEHLFLVLLVHFPIFGAMSIQVLCPAFHWTVWVLFCFVLNFSFMVGLSFVLAKQVLYRVSHTSMFVWGFFEFLIDLT
jgi:hypothetical protein